MKLFLIIVGAIVVGLLLWQILEPHVR